MQTDRIQIIAMALYARAAINGPSGGVASFYPSNAVFDGCEMVTFCDVERTEGVVTREVECAADPNEWIALLLRQPVSAVRLHITASGKGAVSDMRHAGFVGGGARWLLEAIHARGSDYWEARWSIGNQDGAGKKPWQVTYGRLGVDYPTPELKQRSISHVSSDLASALQAISGFARSHEVGEFAELFDRGLAALSSDTPEEFVYHKDLAPPGVLSLDARRLLAAARAGWLFGGMGSWNDVSLEEADQDEYEKLSLNLYNLLNEGALVAVNTVEIPKLTILQRLKRRL